MQNVKNHNNSEIEKISDTKIEDRKWKKRYPIIIKYI